MKKILIYGLCFLVSVFLLTNCESFEATNTNPNVSTEVTPGMLATKLIIDITRSGYDSNHGIGSYYDS
jgi:hypothetical protein